MALAEEGQEHKPIMKTKRIVVIGDGEEASLTAYLLSKDHVVRRFNYQIYLIQGGRGVQNQVKEADEQLTPGFNFVPFRGLKFTLNYLLKDSFHSKIIERHIPCYLKYRFMPFRTDDKFKEKEGEEIQLRNAEGINIENNKLMVGDTEIKEYITKEMNSNLILVRGQVRFIHPFGEYIGHCEIEDCP